MNRSFFLLLGCCVLLHTQTIDAQSIIELKYENGQPQTRYHIREKDTFCIEAFRENGSLYSKSWRNDSAYVIQSNNVSKKTYGAEKRIDWFRPFFQLKRSIYRKLEQSYLRDSVFEFYPDGKCQMRSYFVDNKQFTHFEYLPNGLLYYFLECKKLDENRFQLRINQAGMEQIRLIDTANHRITVTLTNQKRLIQEDIYECQNPFRPILSLLEQSVYDSTGQKIGFWKSDSTQLHPDKDNGLCLYGMRNSKEEWVIQPQYESIEFFNHTQYIVNHHGKYGLINEFGDFIIPCEWDALADLNDDPFDYFKGREIGYLFEPMYDWKQPDANTVLRCRKGKLYGVIDAFGKIILQPIYQDVDKTKYNLYQVKMGGSWGIVDANQQIVVKPNYDQVRFTNDEDLFITVDTFTKVGQYVPAEKIGLINRAGQTLLPRRFEQLHHETPSNRCFMARTHSVKKNYTEGVFHAERGWIIDTMFELSRCHHPDYMIHSTSTMPIDPKSNTPKRKFGVINKIDGSTLLTLDYQEITSFTNQIYRPDLPCKEPSNAFETQFFLLCENAGRYGVFDLTQRKWMLPLKYEYLRPFGDGLFCALEQGKWKCINAQGQSLLHETFDNLLFDMHNYSLELEGFYIQKKDTVYRYDNQSFPYTTNLKENFYSSPTYSLLNYKGDTLIVNDKGKIIVSALERVLAQDTNYFLVQHKKTKLQYHVDNQGYKKSFFPQYEIQQIQSNANLMLVADTTHGRLGMTTLDGRTILPCLFFGLTPMDAQKIIWGKKDFPKIPKTKLGYSRRQPTIWANEKKQNASTQINIPENGVILKYNSISLLDEGWQMYDSLGQLLSPVSFDYPFQWQNHLGIGQVAGKQGLWNAQGKAILPAEYDKIVYEETNKMFYLFRVSKGAQRVYCANADGQLITNNDLKNMSYFYGDWAFVETDEGYGMIQKNGQYWIQPQPLALQQSPMSILDTLLATHQKSLSTDYKAYLQFLEPYEDVRGEQDIAAKQWTAMTDKKQRTLIGNLMIQTVLKRYFLNEARIYWHRQNKIFFCGQNPFFVLNEDDAYDTLTRHIVLAISSTEQGIGLALAASNYTEYPNDIYHSKTPINVGFCKNFKFKNNVLAECRITDILIWNEVTQKALNQLLFQKISVLKNEPMDCGNPEKYWESVQNRFFILPEGLQFYMPRYAQRQRFDKESIPILLTWAELKPYLLN
jgi:WG containing repeat